MLYLIGIPNCNKIKDTRSWLEEKDITYEFINVKKEPLSKEEISELAYKLSTDVLVNKRGTTYRKLEIKDKKGNILYWSYSKLYLTIYQLHYSVTLPCKIHIMRY